MFDGELLQEYEELLINESEAGHRISEAIERILGVPIPHMTIPVRPGRDLARLIEVAALHVKLRRAGHNPAKELNDRLMAKMAADAGGL